MCAKLGGARYGEGEITVIGRVCLHKQDLAVRAKRAHHVEVKRLFAGPPSVVSRIARAAILVHFCEAAVCRGAGRQTVHVAIRREVRFRVGIAIGIDNGDGYRRAAARGYLVSRGEIGGTKAEWQGHRAHRVRQEKLRVTVPAGLSILVSDDMCAAGGDVRHSGRRTKSDMID